MLCTLTIWTDNGAATLGAAWPGHSAPPTYSKLGPNVSYMNWNWSMVDAQVYENVAKSIRLEGVQPRGTQLVIMQCRT